MPQLTVRDLMASSLVTIDARETLLDAERRMSQYRIRHLPVMSDGQFVGMLTQRDLSRASISSLADLGPKKDAQVKAAIPVEWAMRSELTVARPDLSARHACRLMLREKLGCLPVVNDRGELVGLVTEADFAQLALLTLEAMAAA